MKLTSNIISTLSHKVALSSDDNRTVVVTCEEAHETQRKESKRVTHTQRWPPSVGASILEQVGPATGPKV